MTFDEFAFLFKQQESAIQQLIKLDLEVKKAKDDEKKGKEAQAESIRNELLKSDPHLYYHVLAVTSKDSANNLRSTWAKKNMLVDITKPVWNGWKIMNIPVLNLSILPHHSFAIQFTFELEKPYISRDEQEFYIIDNPVRKDKISGLPYVTPSSWKGSLRSALWQLGYKEKSEQIQRIFGNERAVEEEAEFRKGRLRLYPTFFNRKSLEIINPHNREKRVGSFPVYFESVPVDTKGVFLLLYIPFDMVGVNKNETKIQIVSDLNLICEGLRAMFTIYGFGAKTSSGYGIAKPDLTEGRLILKAKDIEAGKKEEPKCQPPEEAFEKYLNEDGSVKDKFKGGGEAGLLSNTEYNERGQQSGGGSLREFKRFRRWYGQYGEKWEKELRSMSSHAEWPTWWFESFDELLNKTKEIERALFPKEATK